MSGRGLRPGGVAEWEAGLRALGTRGPCLGDPELEERGLARGEKPSVAPPSAPETARVAPGARRNVAAAKMALGRAAAGAA